jgi:3-dehydroquinate synthase
MLAARGLHSPAVVVSDENVATHYAGRVMEGLNAADIKVHPVVLQPGEQFKNLATIERLWNAFTQAGVDRSSCVIALGGGVIGDLAGFAAATYLRGIAWVVVPTTLLAMVDASLGGKTGFDLSSGKNLVGAFHPPRFVLADPDVLQTLLPAELRSGMAEVIKHAIIAGPQLFEACSAGWLRVNERLEEIVRRAMAVKVRVIQIDPYEQNERAKLNLGHTLGHAIEHASGYRLRHGEAVAIGMVAAARLAERLGIGERGLAETIERVLRGLDLPTEVPPDLPRERVLQAIGVDKKRASGKVRLVLPVRIGEVRRGIEIDDLGMLLD